MPENTNLNNYADEMIDRIITLISDKLDGHVVIKSAIVKKVNSNGTVNVTVPPNNQTTYTNISNQTPFVLNIGDAVEIILKNGDLTNAWVIAKHGASYGAKD